MSDIREKILGEKFELTLLEDAEKSVDYIIDKFGEKVAYELFDSFKQSLVDYILEECLNEKIEALKEWINDGIEDLLEENDFNNKNNKDIVSTLAEDLSRYTGIS